MTERKYCDICEGMRWTSVEHTFKDCLRELASEFDTVTEYVHELETTNGRK